MKEGEGNRGNVEGAGGGKDLRLERAQRVPGGAT